MIYCGKCGHGNEEGAKFCGNCGAPIITKDIGQKKSKASTEGQGKTSLVDSISRYVSNDQPAELNWRVLFSDVFKHHSTEEAEEIFICGTKATTPSASDVSVDWPHPWLYSRVLLLLLVTFGLLWLCSVYFDNSRAWPGMIVIGSFAVPIATMVLFMEANVWRNVSMYQVLQVFFIGGCASLVVTLFLYSIFNVGELDFVGAFVVGFVEEIGKAIIVVAALRQLGKLSILTGLLIGASVGAGFAAFESAGYAMTPILNYFTISGYAAAYDQYISPDQMMGQIEQTILLRGVLTPGGHVAWAAISGAALAIAAKANKAIDYSLLVDGKFLRLFIIPVVLHVLWDSPIATRVNNLVPYLWYIILVILVWIVVLTLINMGLQEVTRETRRITNNNKQKTENKQ